MVRYKNRDLQSGVLDVIKVLYGDFGAGAIRTCFKVHYCNPTTKIIIFKTRHGPHIYLSSAIPFINKLQNTRIKLSTIYLGASVFHCYKFIQNYQKNLVRQASDEISKSTVDKMLCLTGVLKFNRTQLVT
ncbi:ribonuclease P/MRP protein subunit POP5 isoform X3 [Daktulosphaira vitifoliae]|uniref:ribonuclease P/MRP protein subunit POP5 isoform X3 n=1 Tax=Daktulosphaira vitifoliae TaxID=58002 RepID=UPI0021AA99FE|nr:ribonuclease P/MRP protein subunit POP5 isoform X3 [Daktulosphaira vitifoliae]